MAKFNGPSNVIQLARKRTLTEKFAIAILALNAIQLGLIIYLLAK